MELIPTLRCYSDNNICFMQADKLERLRERMVKVRELFRDKESTEFVIVTIPTVLNNLVIVICSWLTIGMTFATILFLFSLPWNLFILIRFLFIYFYIPLNRICSKRQKIHVLEIPLPLSLSVWENRFIIVSMVRMSWW